MARSPATLHEAVRVLAAAATGWVVLVAVLFRLVAPAPVARGRSARAPSCHRPLSAAVWLGAPRVYAEVDRRARALAPEDRASVARAILEEAERAGLAPLLVLAVIHVESRYDPRALSPVGAMGLMQVMGPTLRAEVAERVDPFDPVANVRAGVRYLGRMVDTFSDVQLALVAYNAGPGRVRHHLEAGGVPARLLAYPHDVLREAVRLWPATEVPAPIPDRPAVRVALAAAHARRAVAADGASPAVVRGHGPDQPPLRAACVPLEVGLPMTRGRERQPAARTMRA